MRKFIVECWDGVMSHDYNPLKHIPDLQVRHMILQILAWLWCIVFSLYIGSWVVLGLTFAAHFLLIAAIAVTIATFTISERVYKFKEGYHSANRGRGSVIYRNSIIPSELTVCPNRTMSSEVEEASLLTNLDMNEK